MDPISQCVFKCLKTYKSQCTLKPILLYSITVLLNDLFCIFLCSLTSIVKVKQNNITWFSSLCFMLDTELDVGAPVMSKI